MKLGIILNARETLSKIANISLKGKQALIFRRLLKIVNEEIELFEEARTAHIKQFGLTKGEGENQTFSIDPKDVSKDVYQTFIDFVNELANTDIDIEIPILLTDDHFDQIELSKNDIDNLEVLGLWKEEEISIIKEKK